MIVLLTLVTLTGTALFYLSDRQQRALAVPLPAAARFSGAIRVLGALLGWAWRLGTGVGLFTGFWVLAIGAMGLPMLIGHLVDGYRPAGRERP